MVGWHRPHLARTMVDMTHCPGACLHRSGLDPHRANPVTVAAEILVAALGDDYLLARRQNQPDTERIFLEPASETLVGDVDQRDEAAVDDHVAHFAPLPIV